MDEFLALAGEGLEHLDVEESGAVAGFVQGLEWWAGDEDVLLPSDVAEEGVAEMLLELIALGGAFGAVVVAIGADGREQEEVPAVALRVAHPEGGGVADGLLSLRGDLLFEVDELEEFAGCGLDNGGGGEDRGLGWRGEEGAGEGEGEKGAH